MLLLAAFCSWICFSSAAGNSRSLIRRDQIADGVNLRVLPIGDSITRGSGDPTNGGYRKSIYEKLSARGNKVEFVGSLSEGNFAQNHHEGHRGQMITEIEQLSRGVGMLSRPNIALLHAGTNDMNRDYLLSEAPDRLEKLVRTIISNSPRVTVFVSQIVPSKTSSTMAAINAFNGKIPGIVNKLEKEGFKVMLVDMRLLTNDDLIDALHPNTRGYEKMANQFYDAIVTAERKGWISAPQAPGVLDPESCQNPDSWHGPVTIAQGPRIAVGDGEWTEHWISRGVVARGNCPRSRLHFMDLNGDGIMDYACVDADTGAVHVNIGKVNAAGVKEDSWGPREKIATGKPGRKGSGVKFADLNGDGRADYVYLDEDTGVVSAWINDGPGASDGGYRWRPLGQITYRADATSENLHFADFTGDGRDDFLLINQDTGEVRGWVNRGDKDLGDFPSFHALGVIASGRSHEDGVDKVILGDFTGKGRVDYLLVKAGGRTTGFINRLQKGSMIPAWGPEITVAGGPKGANARQAMVRLADLDGDGVVDYLLVDEESGEVRMWQNLGTGGKYQAGEFTIFADLDGDGTKDYLWVDSVGNAYGYINVGKGTDAWDNKGLLVRPGAPWVLPRNVRTAVLTKSGCADYVAIEEVTGRAVWWRNTGPNGGFKFEYAGQAARGVWEHIAKMEGFGWKFNTKNVRFADLDGDGLDDYIYISDFGATLWWRNMGVEPINFHPYKIVADGPGITAVDVQFADVNGDGRLDYIVTSQLTGAARVWFNRGFVADGTHIRWRPPVRLAVGPDGVVGRDVRLVEVSGDAHADYVAIDPTNGAARMWRSRCVPAPAPDDNDDDEEEEVDPNDSCKTEDETYSSTSPRMGEYMRWFLMEPEYAGSTGKQYITIVNLTPHPFRLTRTSQHQMSTFDWATIPPGKARQNVAHYSEKVSDWPIDTKGEAYYDIGDTGKKFVVRVTNHIPDTYPRRVVFDLSGMGKGQREYNVPEQEVPVTLVITGSDTYGFITSLRHGPGNWMNAMEDVIKDRRLKEVVVPGTHDAGMSKISSAILTGATASNTQTQGINTYNQLRAGSRWFDLRVQTVHQAVALNKYEFWTTHITNVKGEAPIGRSGAKFQDVIDDINRFTDENKGEVVVLQFRYLIGIRNVPSIGPIYWSPTIKNEFFDMLKQIKNRCPDLVGATSDVGIESEKMGTLMRRNNGNGCVLIFLDTANLEEKNDDASTFSRKDGIYHMEDLIWTDGWPNKEDTKDIADWNVDEWKKSRDDLLVAQWLSTPHFLTSTFVYSIEAIAVLPTNPALYWRGVNEISPSKFPNVLMVDYIGQTLINAASWDDLSAELYTLAIGLNLYTISENCKINKRRSPLLPARNSRNMRVGDDNPLVTSWNGIIFANGTIVDNPPEHLHVGQPEILKNGTIFSNGTVLEEDIPNPEFQGAQAHFNSSSFRS